MAYPERSNSDVWLLTEHICADSLAPPCVECVPDLQSDHLLTRVAREDTCTQMISVIYPLDGSEDEDVFVCVFVAAVVVVLVLRLTELERCERLQVLRRYYGSHESHARSAD